MEKQGKIAAFIESLPMETGIGDCQSTLLVTNMEYLGGNGGDCINNDEQQCYKSNNGGNCKNYHGYCGKSENHGSCMSTDTVMPSTGM